MTLTLRVRCRRCEARLVSGVPEWVRLHPGPAARPLRRSARLQAHEVSPTAVVSPSVLDALEFDLTVEDSTGSECDELVAQARPSALAPEAGVTMMADSQRGRRPSRRLVLVGTQHDSIPPTELDPVRCTTIDGSDTDIVDRPAPPLRSLTLKVWGTIQTTPEERSRISALSLKRSM